LYLAMLARAGAAAPSIGDGTGPLPMLDG